MKKDLLLLPLLLLVGLFTLQAQISTPAPSTTQKVMQDVGLTEVTLEYSRPSAKGRTIFAADGLVPTGKVWRTGANSVSKISFSDDVTVGGTALKAGDYAILSIPNGSAWKVHFYTHEGNGWGGYVEKEPAAIVDAMVKTTGDHVETFTIGINNVTMDGATLDFSWANTMASVALGVEVDSKVQANIDRVMAGPSQNDYYNAASYYLSQEKHMDKALEYINIATAGDSPRFWQVRTKSLILAKMGKKAEAIAAAKQSLDLATKAGNADYIKMNKDSIKEWGM